MSEKKRKENAKNTLSSAQEIYYGREFKKQTVQAATRKNK